MTADQLFGGRRGNEPFSFTPPPNGARYAGTVAGLAGPISDIIFGSRGRQHFRFDPVGAKTLDPSRAIEEIRHQSAGARYGANRLPGGRNLGNTLAAINSGTGRAISDTYAKYDNANAEIENKIAMFNSQLDVHQQDANAKSKANAEDIVRSGIKGVGDNIQQFGKDEQSSWYDLEIAKLFAKRYNNT